jgi:ankyrin repeat protein
MATRESLLRKLTPVSDAMLRNPAPADRLMWRGTYATLGYSPLDQINTKTVRNLGLAWTLALPPSANEAAPLVHDGVLFIEAANTVEAINAADGSILWQYVRSLPDALHNGRDARMKGLAMYEDRLYAPTADGHIVALDVKTGTLRWDRAVVSPEQGVHPGQFDGAYFHISGGPLLAHGKVIVGVSLGIDTGGGDFIVGLDAQSGDEKWRFNTIARPGQPGGDSWNGAPVNETIPQEESDGFTQARAGRGRGRGSFRADRGGFRGGRGGDARGSRGRGSSALRSTSESSPSCAGRGSPSPMRSACVPAGCCVIAVSLLVLTQTRGSLASLIQRGDRKAALEKIRAGADVNEAQPDGTRPIHWAVFKVDYELLDALIAKKAKADVTNEFGATPLAEAVKVTDARMVKALLDAGAGVEGANLDGETALMLAIKTGELPIVQMLIQAGANVNTIEKEHRQTPLMYAAAAKKNAGEMVKLLLSKGAAVKPRTVYTEYPEISQEPRVQYHPAGGLTALLYAARDGCYECVEAMIANGADVNVPTPEGVTPLLIALDNDNNDIAKLLLDYFRKIAPPGVTVNTFELHGGEPYMTPLDSLAYIAAEKAIEASFGKKPVPQRGGGSIPICSLLESELGIKIVFMGFGLDSDNLHSPNEKFNIDNFYIVIETIPYFHKFFAEESLRKLKG